MVARIDLTHPQGQQMVPVQGLVELLLLGLLLRQLGLAVNLAARVRRRTGEVDVLSTLQGGYHHHPLYQHHHHHRHPLYHDHHHGGGRWISSL